MQRFADTDIGRAFASEEDEIVDDKITALSLSFDRYMAASAELFRKRAHYITFWFAIALAVLGNVHLSKLIDHLQKNENIAVEFLGRQENFIDAMKDAQSNLVEASTDATDVETITDNVKEIQANFNTLQDDFDLPIGWGFYPYADGLSGTAKVAGGASGIAAFLPWVLNVLLAGVLIGLGGPFWYKIFRNVSQLGSIARKVGGTTETVGDLQASKHDGKALERTANHVALFKSISVVDTAGPTIFDNPAPVG